MQGHGPSSQRSAGKGLLNEHPTKDSAVPSLQDESKRKAIPQQAIWLWCRGYAHLKIQPLYRYPHHRVQNLLTPPVSLQHEEDQVTPHMPTSHRATAAAMQLLHFSTAWMPVGFGQCQHLLRSCTTGLLLPPAQPGRDRAQRCCVCRVSGSHPLTTWSRVHHEGSRLLSVPPGEQGSFSVPSYPACTKFTRCLPQRSPHDQHSSK